MVLWYYGIACMVLYGLVWYHSPVSCLFHPISFPFGFPFLFVTYTLVFLRRRKYQELEELESNTLASLYRILQ